MGKDCTKLQQKKQHKNNFNLSTSTRKNTCPPLPLAVGLSKSASACMNGDITSGKRAWHYF